MGFFCFDRSIRLCHVIIPKIAYVMCDTTTRFPDKKNIRHLENKQSKSLNLHRNSYFIHHSFISVFCISKVCFSDFFIQKYLHTELIQFSIGKSPNSTKVNISSPRYRLFISLYQLNMLNNSLSCIYLTSISCCVI